MSCRRWKTWREEETGRWRFTGADFSEVSIGSNLVDVGAAKDHAIEAIQQLPEDVSYEDIMERLLFIQKVELGLQWGCSFSCHLTIAASGL